MSQAGKESRLFFVLVLYLSSAVPFSAILSMDLYPHFLRSHFFTPFQPMFFLFLKSQPNLQTAFANAFSTIQEIQTIRSRIGPFWRIYYPSEFLSSLKDLNNFISPFVERAISKSPSQIQVPLNSNNVKSPLPLFIH